MYTEIYPLPKEKTKKLASYLASEQFDTRQPDCFKASPMWEKLTKNTFTAVNPGGVFLNSGHNYINPHYKDTLLNKLILYVLKISPIVKLLRLIRGITEGLLDRQNAFIKLSAKKTFESLNDCQYAQKYINFTPSLEKALSYNAIDIYSAVENIAHIKRTIHDRKLSDKLFFLEIGAGAGMTTLGLLETYPRARAIICDLPETIAVAYTLMSFFSKRNLKLMLPNEFEGDIDAVDADVLFIVPDQLPVLKPGSVDIFINSCSMQEMQIEVITHYFREIARLGKQHSIFYCKNYDHSRQKYQSFKDYPWDMLGKTLYEGIAPFCTNQFPMDGLKHLIKIVEVNNK